MYQIRYFKMYLKMSNGVTGKEWKILHILPTLMECKHTYKNKSFILKYYTNYVKMVEIILRH